MVRSEFLLALLVCIGCSVQKFDPCEDANAISLSSGSCLIMHHRGELDQIESALQVVISNSAKQINEELDLQKYRVTVRYAPQNTISEIGIGGFNPGTREVILSIDPGHPKIEESVRDELAPMLAHEMHHMKRRREVGYGSTLFEAMITEGLADHFSIEMYDIAPPPWSTFFDQPQLDSLIDLTKEEWQNKNYDHSRWFFGSVDIPRWTGYSVGFELVSRFLAKNSEESARTLVDDPARIFNEDND